MKSHYIVERRPLATPLAIAQAQAAEFSQRLTVSTRVTDTGGGAFVTLNDIIHVLFLSGGVVRLVVNDRVIAEGSSEDPAGFLAAEFQDYHSMNAWWQDRRVCKVVLSRRGIKVEGADNESQTEKCALSNLEASLIFWALGMGNGDWNLERYAVPVIDMDRLLDDAREFAQKVLEG